jgi:hypothetical protein
VAYSRQQLFANAGIAASRRFEAVRRAADVAVVATRMARRDAICEFV